MSCRRPNINGLPGRSAIFQKSSSMPLRSQRRLNEVMISDRSTAKRNQNIGLGRHSLIERIAQGFEPILGYPKINRDAASLPHDLCQSITVGGDDLIRPITLTGRNQFVASRENCHARQPNHFESRVIGRSGEGKRSRIEDPSRLQQQIALFEVQTGFTDIPAECDGFGDLDLAISRNGVFLDHDAVCAFRNRRACKNADSFTCIHSTGKRMPCCRLADQFQRDRHTSPRRLP